MGKENTINNNSGSLTIDPGSVANSYIQYSINGTSAFRKGVKTSDSSYALSVGSSLGTNDTFRMTTAGQRTLPLQSAFLVEMSTQLNVTGDGSVYAIPWDTEIFDQDNNQSGGTFTAPTTGLYRFNIQCWWKFCTSSSFTDTNIALITTNATYTGGLCNPYIWSEAQDGLGAACTSFNVLTNMTTGDTATSTFTMSGGTKTIEFSSVLPGVRGGWCGRLIC